MPPIEGLSDVDYWTTREATSAREVPDRLAVLGGGVAGTELAQAFARLGASVTLVARGSLLRAFPEEAAALVAAGLRADGVNLLLHTGTDSVRENDDGSLTLVVAGGGTVTVDKLLVTTGRHPALEGLGLESVGLAGADGRELRLSTDSTGLVSGGTGNDAAPWLYAAGDAAGKVMLTHQGKYGARATGDAIAARARGELGADAAPWSRYARTADDHAVPNVVFTDPELASVGRTVRQAERDGFSVSSVELPIEVAGSSLHAERYEGWAQPGGRRETEGVARSHLCRPGCGRAAARRHDRRRRRGADGPAVARRTGLPHDQRDLAAAARGIRPLTRQV